MFKSREILKCRAAALAAERGDHSVFAALHAELREAPTLLSAADPARNTYYALVGRLDEAIKTAISNSYLEQTTRRLRVHLIRVRRLAADDDGRFTATSGAKGNFS